MDTFEQPGFSFPVGYHRFHRKQLYNYQLNRPFSLGYARSQDLAEAGRHVRSFDDWKAEMRRQAEKALAEGRTVQAAFHYRVVGFEGPGQGAARRKSGLSMDFRWEKPVGAVLDHLSEEDVTLIGLSMGGYFALRAAAFEKRVQRVIASGHAYAYMKIPPRIAEKMMVFFHDRLREFTNKISRWKIRQGGMEAWNISHLMYVVDTDEPMAAMDFALQLNEENLCSAQVTQDVLILASDQDHFIPFRLHQEQLRRLTAARSVSDRVFTERDHAQNHCQIGNIGLALEVMADWMQTKETA